MKTDVKVKIPGPQLNIAQGANTECTFYGFNTFLNPKNLNLNPSEFDNIIRTTCESIFA